MARTRDPRPRARRLLTRVRNNGVVVISTDADKAAIARSLCSLISDWDKGDETRARIYAWNLKDPKHAPKRKRA